MTEKASISQEHPARRLNLIPIPPKKE